MSEVRFAKTICSHDVEALGILLKKEPDLVNSRVSNSPSSLPNCLLIETEEHDDDGEFNSWLHWCFQSGSHNIVSYCECVELLVNHGADINKPYFGKFYFFSHGFTPVFFAVQVKCLRCLRFLIEKGADLSIATHREKTALIFAIQIGAYAIAATLIQHSTPALINHKDKDGMTALMLATDCSTLTQKLIEAGADVNITDKEGNTALMLAIVKRAHKSVKILIQHSTPALLNHTAKDGKTALMWVAAWYEEDASFTIQQLIEAGADQNITCNGDTALIFAILNELTKNVKTLIQYSTPTLINHRGSFGMTALMRAVRVSEPAVFFLFQLLIEAGADLNITDKEGKTALMWAVNGFRENTPSICSQLIKAGANLNNVDIDGNTALILACKIKKDAKFAEILIQHSTPALINHRDNEGRTALMWSMLYCQELEHKAYFLNFEEDNAFLCLSFCRHLIEAGADVNLRDNLDKTALSYALEGNFDKIVHLLLEAGAVVNTISVIGLTPLYHAFEMKHLSISSQILNLGADPTFSLMHTNFVNQMISTNDAAKLRMLVMNGFPPQKSPYKDAFYLRHTNNLQHSASPLYLALWRKQPATARYLIKNKFFTPSDINRNLLTSTKLRRRLTQFGANECLQILSFHLQTVQTLSTLCLITISSALTQDFRQDNVGKKPSSTEWRFTPTFKERVESIGLPPKLQRALLHQTPTSRICCGQWENISLEEERQFPDCNECILCTGEVNLYDYASDQSETDWSDSFDSDGSDTDTSGLFFFESEIPDLFDSDDYDL